jgi:hypothetical protein
MRISSPSLIPNQVPEFVRSDYPTFVSFVEAYYEYLDNNGVDISDLRDLDTTIDDFIQYFRRELAVNLPENITVDDKLLLENIKKHYLAKGSEASYKLLFRLLYNKPVELKYPGTQMLRASDGRWQQDVSIFVKVSTGTPDLIEGKLVDVVKPNATFKVLVDRRQYVEIEVDRIVQLSDNVYEIFIDRRFFGNIEIGDIIRYETIFAATVVSTTSKLGIAQTGTGFKAGQLFELKNGTGVRSILKITRVDSTGAIIAAEFIKFGVGYNTDFTVSINANQDYFSKTNALSLASTLINGQNITINEATPGNAEQGYINIVDYTVNSGGSTWNGYWDGTYAGNTVREFSTVASLNVVTTLGKEAAIIKVNLGPLANYPGYYTSNAGFLSDAIYIQDSRYYQAFSYVLKIDERLASYKSAVRTMVHPAGTALFGEYQISNSFDVSAALESVVRILSINTKDFVTMVDLGDTLGGLKFNIQKRLDDYPVIVDTPALITGKLFADEAISTPTDYATLLTTKNLSDNIDPPTDAITTIGTGKSLTETLDLSVDTTVITLGKSLTDSFNLADIQEILIFTTAKYLTDSTPYEPQEEGYLAMNPYSEGNYFAVTPIIYDNTIDATWTTNIQGYVMYNGVYNTAAASTRKLGMDRVQYYQGFFPVYTYTLSMDNNHGGSVLVGDVYGNFDFSIN